jgi:hypothetical protein
MAAKAYYSTTPGTLSVCIVLLLRTVALEKKEKKSETKQNKGDARRSVDLYLLAREGRVGWDN